MRFLIGILFAAGVFAQTKSHQVQIIVNPAGIIPGKLIFETQRSDGKFVTIQAPDTASATYALTLPVDTPATNGECIKSTTAGVLSFGACDGGLWTLSGSDIYRATGSVTIGSATPDGKLTVVSAINDGITVKDPTVRGIIWPSSVATNSLVVGTTTNHPVVFYSNNTEALRLSPGGALLTRSHITTVSPSAADIGDATNYFQTLYVENIDGAPAGVTGNYAIFRKIEVADQAGGTNKWDIQANAVSGSASLFIRDQSGNKVIEFFRVVSSSPADYADVYVDLLPDVNGSQRLGSSSKRWQTAYIQDLDISGGSVYGHLVPITDDTYRLGDSNKRWSETWTDNFSATGTVKLGSSSTIGHVWTATDTAGNGTWSAVPGGVATSRLIATSSPLSGGGDLSADRTLSCPTCFTTGGGTINGGINAGIKVTDGTASALFWASSLSTNSIVIGTDSLHDLILFGHNGERARLTGTGMTVTGTLAVSGITTLSGDLRFGADNTQAIGQDATRPSVIYSRIVNTPRFEIDAGSGNFFRFDRSSANVMDLRDQSGNLITRWDSSGADISITADIWPSATNTYTSGLSVARWSKTWTTDFDASGTVKLGTSSTVGQVWTASDTAGNGGWATPGSSQWTTSGSDIYYSTGRVTVGSATPDTILTVRGGTNDGVAITDGTARGIMFASSALTNSIVFGTTSAHPLAVYAGNALHTAFWPSGNSCVGCTNDTYKWEVNGTFRAAGNSLIGGTLGVTGATTFSSTVSVLGALSTVGVTFAGNVVPNLDSTWEIGSAGQRVAGLFYNGADTYGSHRIRNGANITFQSGSTLFLDSGSSINMTGNITASALTISPTEVSYLDNVSSNIQTQLNAKGSGTVTSIATSSPISGGTITTTGTISCPTCYTTAGGTISGNAVVTGTLAVNSTLSTGGITFAGNVLPNLDSTWEIGSAGARVAGLFYNGADTYGSHRIRNGANIAILSGGSIFADPGSTVDFSGTVTTGGSGTLTSTLSCGSGQAIKTLTVSRGLITAATCGAP